MNIQNFDTSDIAILDAMRPNDWPDIRPIFNYYTLSPFCFPMKAVLNNKTVGVGTAILHNDVAWLAHIIVHPENRNKGVGRFITQSLVELVRKKNIMTTYLIATDLGAPVYEKLGFVTETEYLFFKDFKKDSFIGHSKNIIPIAKEYHSQLADLDKRVSGENRLFQLEPHFEDGYLYLQEGLVKGFYLPGFGEGLILSDSGDAGIELMKLRLSTNENASFPKENASARNFMYSHNYKEFKTAKRMRHGKERIWHAEMIFNRIAGKLG